MAPVSPVIRELCNACGVLQESEEAGDDEVEAEEMGMRSGKVRCGTTGEGGIEDD
jgi:hypothetical protein